MRTCTRNPACVRNPAAGCAPRRPSQPRRCRGTHTRRPPRRRAHTSRPSRISAASGALGTGGAAPLASASASERTPDGSAPTSIRGSIISTADIASNRLRAGRHARAARGRVRAKAKARACGTTAVASHLHLRARGSVARVARRARGGGALEAARVHHLAQPQRRGARVQRGGHIHPRGRSGRCRRHSAREGAPREWSGWAPPQPPLAAVGAHSKEKHVRRRRRR
jgi:hypothetical protein